MLKTLFTNTALLVNDIIAQGHRTYIDSNRKKTCFFKTVLHFFFYFFFQVDKMLAEDIAKLMTLIPNEELKARQDGTDRIEGGAFDGVLNKDTPFMFKGGEGVNAGVGEQEWVVAKDRYKYDEMFDKLSPVDGKITGAGKKNIFYYYFFFFSKLENSTFQSLSVILQCY